MMKTTLITTINHNVGDDFVREGIQFLIKQAFGDSSFSLIHKHIPLTVRPEWEWYYLSGLSRQLDRLPRAKGLFWSRIIDHLRINHSTDKIISCDLLVQSGAPVYWNGAQNNEWFVPLIRNRYLNHCRYVPFLNLGAGTCIPYHCDAADIVSNPDCVAYIKELHGLCSVTTVRDKLSKKILNLIGLDAPVLPCPSIFARDNLGIEPQSPDYVALNFMPLGGHYEFGQGINTCTWENHFSLLYKNLYSRSKILFVCHDQREYDAVSRIAPGAPRFIGQSAQEYLQIYARARYYIGCRVHAAFATASFGRPALIVGNDSRALMAAEIGLKSLFVNDVNYQLLQDEVNCLEASATSYDAHMASIRQRALIDYLDILGTVLPENHEKHSHS